MRLIFLGPPGVGKGTMATRTKDLLGIPHISTGELFRENVSKGTPLGIEVKAIMERGDLVPDEMTVAMVKDRLEKPDASEGFILDGFPRTIPQAESLSDITGLDFVLNLQCPSEELIKRLTGRRFCPACNRTYHIYYMPPKNEGRCDEDGTDLLTRDDDSFESVKNRLEVYTKSTEPLIHWYEKHGLLENIDASVAPDNVFESIRQVLNR
jgi:adenylate kinase